MAKVPVKKGNRANPKNKIFHIKNGRRIEFAQFLKSEKKKRRMNWPQMKEHTQTPNLTDYVHIHSSGQPNNPPEKVFLRIISKLGYDRNEFVFQDLAKPPSVTYESKLIKLGNAILQMNIKKRQVGKRLQKLSTTVIKEIVGDAFYRKYAKGPESIAKIYADLLNINPKYAEINLQTWQVSRSSRKQSLLDFEIDIIKQCIIEKVMEKGLTKKGHFPKGTLKHIAKVLNQERLKRRLPERGYMAIQNHVSVIWKNKKKRITLTKGSPPEIRDFQIELIERNIQEIDKEGKYKKILNPLKDADNTGRNRLNFFKYASIGHNKLVYFLMDPENFNRYIGNNLTLQSIDFPTSPDIS
jgi:hypothetical protein